MGNSKSSPVAFLHLVVRGGAVFRVWVEADRDLEDGEYAVVLEKLPPKESAPQPMNALPVWNPMLHRSDTSQMALFDLRPGSIHPGAPGYLTPTGHWVAEKDPRGVANG